MLPPGARLTAAGRVLDRARTFSDLPPGAAFWYENSNGLAELAVNQGRADRDLGLAAVRSRSSHERRPAALTQRQQPTKQRPHPHRPKPPERGDEPQASANRRLAEQTRKILRKHYMSKYRVQ
jgi:hypothetical protein